MGSLTSSYRFKDGGLVKKVRLRSRYILLEWTLACSARHVRNPLALEPADTQTMSVSVNGFSQHMVSYYTVEDVLAGKLRSPSSIPELASLEISAEYLHKQNFRFPPMIEVGVDGVPRYR